MEVSSGTERARSTLAYLRRKIATGEWPVNSRIPIEPELMELMGVGKSTVREAVRSLAGLGMLETLPGRGTFVRSRTPITSVLTEYVSDYSIEDIQTYRRAIEIEAVQLAAMNRTDEHLKKLRERHAADVRVDDDYPSQYEQGIPPDQFHFLIVEASGSRLLQGLYAGAMEALRVEVDRGGIVYGATRALRHDDHEAIIDALEQRNVHGAAHAMALHVDRDLVRDSDGDVLTQRAEVLLARAMQETARITSANSRAAGSDRARG